MKRLKAFITSFHQSTKRNYIERMNITKPEKIIIAKKYDYEFWDAGRDTGYGGYTYQPGRWKNVALNLIENYKLKPNSKILDVGCGKGFLLHEMKLILPGLQIFGFDISPYAISKSTDLIRPFLFEHKAEDKYTYKDNEFDLVISISTLHNLRIFDLEKALKEIHRVGKKAYIVVESYRDEQELFNLQCWALTCESFFHVDEWDWIFKKFNYSGDYEFIFFN